MERGPSWQPLRHHINRCAPPPALLLPRIRHHPLTGSSVCAMGAAHAGKSQSDADAAPSPIEVKVPHRLHATRDAVSCQS